MQDSLEAAARALLSAQEGPRPSLAPVPRRRSRSYAMSGSGGSGVVARVNPDLALAFSDRVADPRVSVAPRDFAALERLLSRMRETQNFSFWSLGAFFRLVQSFSPAEADFSMAERLFRSLQLAMMDLASDSATALVNVRALRRESFLGLLPSSFGPRSRALLRRSSVDSPFLFEDDKVREALDQADKVSARAVSGLSSQRLSGPRPVSRYSGARRSSAAGFRSLHSVPPRPAAAPPQRPRSSAGRRGRGGFFRR